MKYYLYRLRFKTGIHIGEHKGRIALATSGMGIHADTIFSALCHEALQNGGQVLLDKMAGFVKDGELLFSDAFPYQGREYYLPKPVLGMTGKRAQSDSNLKKKFKALKYIPASRFSEYLSGLRGEIFFDPENIQTVFGNHSTLTKVAIKGMKDIRGLEETRPYHVGVFQFFEDCGLYLILAYQGEEQRELFNRLVNSLSYTGIGGKRTSGLGKFEVLGEELQDIPEEDSSGRVLAQMLKERTALYQMNLSVALPQEEELELALENAYYSLIRRGGFVQSQTYSDTPMKKRVQYFFAAGSCFKKSFEGDLYDVSYYGHHPVYRYAKPIFLGVKI
jgi:CRISPR-associated protein Csm4